MQTIITELKNIKGKLDNEKAWEITRLKHNGTSDDNTVKLIREAAESITEAMESLNDYVKSLENE